jgi:tyrosyl-tRNA synthetase
LLVPECAFFSSPLIKTNASVYVGFDPTAESIHLGNLISYLCLFRFRAAGYNPIVLFGGATGLIGDPSGRSSERSMLSEDEVNHNVAMFRSQFMRLESRITEEYFAAT